MTSPFFEVFLTIKYQTIDAKRPLGVVFSYLVGIELKSEDMH